MEVVDLAGKEKGGSSKGRAVFLCVKYRISL